MAKKPVHIRQKYIESGFQDYPDYRIPIQFAIDDSFRKTDSYKEVERQILTDSVLSTAAERVGYFGEPEQIIRRVLLKSYFVVNGRLVFDAKTAKSVLSQLRDGLAALEITYRATARLLGVNLTTSGFSLTDNIIVARLTEEEINDRQFFTDDTQWIYGSANFLGHNAEIRITLIIPFGGDSESSYSSSLNRASQQVEIIFNEVLSAFRLYKTGRIDLGPMSVDCFPVPGSVANTIFARYVSTNEMQIALSDIEPLQESYRLVSKGISQDNVLDRGLRRFLLARQRRDLIDQLIDLVISWESILLTVNNNAIRSELSYRFSLNGASILHASHAQRNRHSGRALMDCAYSVRSLVVHGGSAGDVDKELRKVGLGNLSQLVEEVEDNFRKVVFWLSSIDVKDRPYKNAGGWEEFLWDASGSTD